MAEQAAKRRERTGGGSDRPRLFVVFGDQLDLDAALLESVAPDDTVFMAEVAEESSAVPSHIQRTTLFLSAMRHFAAGLKERGIRTRYVELDDPRNTGRMESEITRAARELNSGAIVCTRPGDWRIVAMLERARSAMGIPVEMMADGHFLTTPEEFASWAQGRKTLTMEFFYREQRRRDRKSVV